MERVHFSPQTIYSGDCLRILDSFPDNCVDLIYIDPPFNSNRNYEVFWGDTQEQRAFDDRFGDAMAYIDYMRPRVEQLYRVLKKTGSFYYHCDWHASHYIKIMLDEIFGFNNFQTEIVWRRSHPKGLATKRMPNNHDTVFLYTVGDDYTWNSQFRSDEESMEQIGRYYKLIEHGTGRRYRLASLINPNQNRPNLTYEFLGVTRVWRWTKDRMLKAHKDGRIVQKKEGTVPAQKLYLDESKGLAVDSIWNDILPVQSQSKERLGYPTQKPLALLDRIINTSSNPGDIVLDAFCGCGTALVAAQQLGRRWLGIDISPTSCNVMGQRLEDVCKVKQAPPLLSAEEVANAWNSEQPLYRFSNLPRDREQLRALPGFEFENWAVLQLGQVLQIQGHQVFAKTNLKKVGDLGLDGRMYLADKVSLPHKEGETLFGEKQPYLPIQVKNTKQVGRPDIDKFETALRRDGRKAGFFIGWDFSKDALKEIERIKKLPESERLYIFPVETDQLIAESFNLEFLALLK